MEPSVEYKIIDKPMDLEKIKRKLTRGHYANLEEYKDDVHLMFDNAKTYNGEVCSVRCCC